MSINVCRQHIPVNWRQHLPSDREVFVKEAIVDLNLKEKIEYEHEEKDSVDLAKGSLVPQIDRMRKSYFI